MIGYLTHSVESVLDLFTVSQIQQVIEHQTMINDDTVDDWEPQHLIAAEQLCLYAEELYPKQLAKCTERLRRKLKLTDEQ
jgi:hypothetical protein